MENGKVKFKYWHRTTSEERRGIIDDYLDEHLPEDCFSEIHPELRVVDLPLNYINLQVAWMHDSKQPSLTKESLAVVKYIFEESAKIVRATIRDELRRDF